MTLGTAASFCAALAGKTKIATMKYASTNPLPLIAKYAIHGRHHPGIFTTRHASAVAPRTRRQRRAVAAARAGGRRRAHSPARRPRAAAPESTRAVRAG